MHLTLDWGDAEKTILRLAVFDDWTWDDMFAIKPAIFTLMHDSRQTVHILVDFTQTDHLLKSGTTNTVNLVSDLPASFGLLVIVTRNRTLQRLVKVFQATFPPAFSSKIQAVGAFDDAYQLFAGYTSAIG